MFRDIMVRPLNRHEATTIILSQTQYNSFKYGEVDRKVMEMYVKV